MYPRNTHEKNFGPTKYPWEKYLKPRKTRQKFWSDEIPTKKNFGLTKYPRETILDLRNTHEKKIWTLKIPPKARWHDGTRPTGPTMAGNAQNLVQSNLRKYLSCHSTLGGYIHRIYRIESNLHISLLVLSR